jgi:hypothetical protein
MHNKELHSLYFVQNITGVITLKIVQLAGHVACVEEIRNLYIFL